MLPRHQTRNTVLIVLALGGIGGCTPEVHQYKRFPNFLNPGPAAYQRAEAIQHDPYPLDDVGPEVVGGRPREYQIPVNEVERANMAAPRRLRAVSPMVAPSLPPGPPPVVTSPFAPVPPPPTITPVPPSSAQIQRRAPY
jgi:hypothetical protein